MKPQSPPKVFDQGLSFLDPSECGSTIAWRVSDSGWEGDSIDCSVQLTDCGKLITWSIECNDQGIKKLQNAIETLQAALHAVEIGKILQEKKIAKEEKAKKKKKQPK
jgi:hypothetical protein